MPVYKDSKTGKYYYSVRYKDTFGQNKRKMKRGFDRQKDAKKAENDFIQKVKHGYSDNQLFETVFYDRLKGANLSERSIQKRMLEYNKYIKPKFGQIPIGKISTHQCRELRDSIINDYDLSLSYARSVWAGFKAVMSYANKHYKLIYDPTLPVEPIPRVKPKADYITREEFDKQVEKMENNTSRELTKLLFYSGLRIGEALALQWNDFDKLNGELNINKTMYLQKRKIMHETKTESSKSIIPIPHFIKDMLAKRYEIEKEKYKYFKDDFFIFGNLDPMSYNTFTVHFKKIFPDIRIHTLRHSYATYLINNGVDMYVLMELMRHSNITETIQTYSHLYNGKKQEAMKVFG
ncbi:site-specific integrase [Staphylococcus sciuri]|uniref:site-specific integrase n=1 Tax=Mammaliicoccus sciuri TaxID=1296 RepID=UPI0015CFEA51|nr:site-specific integrase [Mammaliicoccus sciuri]MBF0719806.1 site-specific integrase [Mammaliicoccus sciuri]NYS38567.1 site-specific integrase [Mammaliicoccus sciuri]